MALFIKRWWEEVAGSSGARYIHTICASERRHEQNVTTTSLHVDKQWWGCALHQDCRVLIAWNSIEIENEFCN